MNNTKRKHIRKITAICAAAVIAAGMGTTAYAANIGGIQRTVQIWLHGDQTSATLDIDNSGEHTSYKLTYEDENGQTIERQGGGVAYDFWGNEIPLTEQDIINELNSPDVEFKEDGTVFVCYKEQTLDITDKFDEDGYCYTQLNDGDQTIYMTISKTGAFGTSTTNYPSAKEVDCE